MSKKHPSKVVSEYMYLQVTQTSVSSVTVKPGTMTIMPQQAVPLQTIQALQSKSSGQTNILPAPMQLQQQGLKSVSVFKFFEKFFK